MKQSSRSRLAIFYDETADHLEGSGWTSSRVGAGDGRCSVDGAMWEVLHRRTGGDLDLGRSAQAAFLDVVGLDVAAWNDTVCTSEKQALIKLRAMASFVRAMEDCGPGEVEPVKVYRVHPAPAQRRYLRRFVTSMALAACALAAMPAGPGHQAANADAAVPAEAASVPSVDAPRLDWSAACPVWPELWLSCVPTDGK
ncbi:MAG: hypothetical protein NVS3B24_13930 [Candidatus Dormibacteria bacterium]